MISDNNIYPKLSKSCQLPVYDSQAHHYHQTILIGVFGHFGNIGMLELD